MATTFKNHSTTEIQEAIEKALGELFGGPVAVNIRKVVHHTPSGVALVTSNSAWSVDLELHVKDEPPEMDLNQPF
ncbi:hypothetical protein C8245_21330 [Paracidovorax avenae]|uniref:hypothetical protein n=1 Tax=Paracidovorax avenae TaxID=80867 RepID=UPI000D20C001|nr:hypothetical protein [Paracidovorax avenae]AVS67872.1 hypothetical protein C8245_21330 [Paracidovorax avenae]